MDYNVYAPPTAAVAEVPVRDTTDRDFHVVGKAKFFSLFLLSFGAYIMVWMYQHWAQFKRRRRVAMWPVARGIFPIFFTHSLTEEIDTALQRANVRHAWSPNGTATMLVILLVGSNLFSRIPDSVVPLVPSMTVLFACLLAMAILAWRIQRAANVACNDPDGSGNRGYTWANWLWAVPLGVFWALVLLGFAGLALGA
ncbi:MAG: hypothetical protein HOQ01_00335 [Lysobacter sp.]|nr:hypothetical protein [Lysobacter sp.]